MARTDDKIYAGFLGRWRLIPESCQFEQGEAYADGFYEILEVSHRLHLRMEWTDVEGAHHRAEFSGVPDGSMQPFKGGNLADALSISAVSNRDLRSTAWYQGRKLMAAQYQLDDTLQAMRVVQIVRLPDGSQPANISVYRKELLQ